MSDRPRRSNGRFKSAMDIAEDEINAEVGKHMAAGAAFDEAWLLAGGDIIATTESSSGAAQEVRKAYAAVGREPLRIGLRRNGLQ